MKHEYESPDMEIVLLSQVLTTGLEIMGNSGEVPDEDWMTQQTT